MGGVLLPFGAGAWSDVVDRWTLGLDTYADGAPRAPDELALALASYLVDQGLSPTFSLDLDGDDARGLIVRAGVQMHYFPCEPMPRAMAAAIVQQLGAMLEQATRELLATKGGA